MNTKRNVTIYDIAKLSGFSPKTVSRVVNGEQNVKKSTFEKVTKVINELNYIPNTYARSLINKTKNNVLISIQSTEQFPIKWIHILLEKITIECRKHGLNIMVEYHEPTESLENSILSSSSSFIGAAVIFYEAINDKRIRFLKEKEIPFIVFGKSSMADVLYVSNNDYEALFNLGKYLVERKLKKLVMLIALETLVNKDRVRGVQDAFRAEGLDVDNIEVVYNIVTIEDTYRYCKNMFTKFNLPDAIFVSGDEKVIGLNRAFFELDIKIPEDVSVIGFDNIPFAEYYSPSLTTIGQDYVGLSKEIVDRLIHLIAGNTELSSIELSTELIIRESVK
ncbi:DNA-binding LacI/PurR family transcriptional regulator [Paenibacillus sp. DS2015]|uniref:LacI family DNA-binding transcriptional regulator n=1 Tax=Paenibacillus sp. DS2015 TaxID=3373917 RepID=UPI003D1B1AF2